MNLTVDIKERLFYHQDSRNVIWINRIHVKISRWYLPLTTERLRCYKSIKWSGEGGGMKRCIVTDEAQQVRTAGSKGPTLSYKEAARSSSGICGPDSLRMIYPWRRNTEIVFTDLHGSENYVHSPRFHTACITELQTL